MLELVGHPPKSRVETIGGQQLLQRFMVSVGCKLFPIEVVTEVVYGGNQRQSLQFRGGVPLLHPSQLA